MINKNKFTIKILLISVLPILILFIFLGTLQIKSSHDLSSNTSVETERALYDIYTKVIKMKSKDIIDDINFKCSGTDNLIKRVKNKKIGQNGFVFLVQSNGEILHLSESAVNLLRLTKKVSSVNLKNSEIEVLKSVAENIKKSKEFMLHTIADANKTEYLISFQKMKNFHLDNNEGKNIQYPLYLSLVAPMSPFYVATDRIKEPIISYFHLELNDIIVVSFIILLTVLLIAIFFAFKETKQIRLINDGIKNIGKRNFGNSIEVITSDDLGDLAKTFNEMSLEIQKTYQDLEEHAVGLEEKVNVRTQEIEDKNRQLEELLVRDHLTGLYNRTKLDEVLEYEFKRSKRYNSVFGVIMIDIDFFKKVNDTHGHQAGDTVLIEFAKLLEENSRETDTVGRWGGEEFLIIVENIDQDSILMLAEKLRASIDAYEFSIVKHKTASFGVTIYRSEDEINKIVARADIALYKAKHNGRNRVEFL